jgi:hypothetical protein
LPLPGKSKFPPLQTYLDVICFTSKSVANELTIETHPETGGVSSTINSFDVASTVKPTKSVARTITTYPLVFSRSRPGS